MEGANPTPRVSYRLEAKLTMHNSNWLSKGSFQELNVPNKMKASLK